MDISAHHAFPKPLDSAVSLVSKYTLARLQSLPICLPDVATGIDKSREPTGRTVTEPNHRTISIRTVNAISADGANAIYWDRDLPGFGLRVYATGRKT